MRYFNLLLEIICLKIYWREMKTYQFRFNNGTKTSAILIWLLIFSFFFMLISISMLFKVASKRRSGEIITLDKDGFTSTCFGSVLFSDITAIKIPAREISLLGGEKL